VRNSALSIIVWSTHPVPVGETSSRLARSKAPVRSSSAIAISVRPSEYIGSELYPMKTRIGDLRAGSPSTSSISSGETTSVTNRRPCRPRCSKGEVLSALPETSGETGGMAYAGSTFSLERPMYPMPAL
jgi:hypothetical protein